MLILLLHARIDRILQKHGVIPQRRYHLDTTEAVLAMVAVASGWTILPPLAVYKPIAPGDRIRAWPLPGKPLHRTIRVVCQKGQRLHIAAQIRDAAIDALNEHFLPEVRTTMPDIVGEITLHGTAAG
jgi:DNA-binding transcriptional LysR family regulator